MSFLNPVGACVLGATVFLFSAATPSAQPTPKALESPKTQGQAQAASETFWLPSTIRLTQNSSSDLLLDDSGENDLLTDEDSLLDESSQDDLLTADDDLLLDDSGENDLLTDEDSLLDGGGYADQAKAEEEGPSAVGQHEALFAESRYPSANTCAACHPKQYREWSVSQHAYAQLSPVYMAMQMTINSLTSGTNGDFCVRCHTQVGMNMEESFYASNLDRHPTSREGVTCVACHRVNQNYGKVSGRVALQQGDLYTAVYGPSDGSELNRVLDSPGEYKASADRDTPGREFDLLRACHFIS